MNVWNKVLSVLPKWQWTRKYAKTNPDRLEQNTLRSSAFLTDANAHLKDLIEDTSIPAAVRAELAAEFEAIEAISEKLHKQEIHIAAFGRVGVGKSSLLNALLNKRAFTTSALHGETTQAEHADWQTIQEGQVVLIDTPGIDEMDGESREALARRVTRMADLVLVVCEGDLTATEFEALRKLRATGKSVILVLNKSDRYSGPELESLLRRLAQRCTGLLNSDCIVSASADPRPEAVVNTDSDGATSQTERSRPHDTHQLQQRLWDILEKEGKSLAALNATLFAQDLDQQVATRIVLARRKVADNVIRKYCVSKGLVVAANPIPVADLLAAAGTDVAMIIHLGEVYGFSLSRQEASKLVFTISAQLVALMSAYWGMNLVSSALKGISAGLSTTLTAIAQGALAWYATYLTGEMAKSWFARGKSWGSGGPRQTARAIMNSLDRDSILQTARDDIRNALRKAGEGF